MPARAKGGAPRVAPSWETGLVRHLQQFKRYPSEAQSRSEEGVVLLSFSVDRTGHVLEHHSAQFRPSGLDDEVMSMIERAQPLPPFPASMTEAKLDLTVPIRFSLRVKPSCPATQIARIIRLLATSGALMRTKQVV